MLEMWIIYVRPQMRDQSAISRALYAVFMACGETFWLAYAEKAAFRTGFLVPRK